MDKDVVIVRGDTLAFAVEFCGLTENLTSAFFTCRNVRTTEVVFQKSLGNGIERTEDEVVTYNVRVAPEDTKDLGPEVRYCYDFEVGINDDVWTILKGRFIIESDITY